jgi:hypothetical protein
LCQLTETKKIDESTLIQIAAYFWDNENEVIDRLARVLKPEGTLLIVIRPKHQMVHYPFTKYGFKMFSKDD